MSTDTKSTASDKNSKYAQEYITKGKTKGDTIENIKHGI